MTAAEVETALRSLRESLQPALRSSFFVTSVMSRRLRQGEVNGVLPLLYFFLARTGHEIAAVEYLGLGDRGQLAAASESSEKLSGISGVRITFKHPDARGLQDLYYFRADVSDSAVNRDQRFLDYLRALGQANSYLKAASYLMHTNGFTKIRDFLLARSSSILQDDSGIPYRFFQGPDWHVALYGNYSRPISDFLWAEQTDLLKAYHDAGAAKPMPFRTGYGTRDKANLLFAAKTGRSMKLLLSPHI